MLRTRRLRPLVATLALAAIPVLLAAFHTPADARSSRARGPAPRSFKRIATFPVYRNTDIAVETVAEIVAASQDGRTLVYTDSETESLGFVDISNPANPQPAGVVALPGEPTSVGVDGKHALVCVNTSPDFVNPSGSLLVIDMNTRQVVRTMSLGGQPDCIAISPDRRYAVIAIENERDEDLGNGEPPQAPPGFVVIVRTQGNPEDWTQTNVALAGVPDLFPQDPEPEYIDINQQNVAVVTMQENNHIALIDLRTATVVGDWPCGTVNLDGVDILENELIEQVDSLSMVPREPDAVTWITDDKLATADEGDLYGGSRGFTIFEDDGSVYFAPGNAVEHLAARFGHYPEERSENKGNEPESVEYARYGNDKYLFVGSERSSVVFVYELDRFCIPRFKQVLPTTIGPEGLLAIPNRDLFVVACEVDDPGGFRSSITIFQRTSGAPTYPKIGSVDRSTGEPIAWAALSALAADPSDAGTAFTVHDSFFVEPRVYELDVSTTPATIVDEIVLRDGGSPLADVDAEGLTVGEDGEFWVASEGRGSVDDPSRPVEFTNKLLRCASDGTLLDTISLPASVNDRQRRFGLEGCAYVDAADGPYVYACWQREWVGDPSGYIRIGRYDVDDDEWRFYYYPREAPVVTGWVGLSEIVALGDETFAVLERDNQADVAARIKRIYTFSVSGLTPLSDASTGSFPVVTKTLVRDLIPDLTADNGPVLDKPEGMTVLANGDVLVVTDNDGVDDSSGETQLVNLGDLFD